MKKIGLLYGREQTFPQSIIAYINTAKSKNFMAEEVKVGALQMDSDLDYHVIFDRISHTVPFYNSALKAAALNGTKVINNPFWNSADDNFFHAAIAKKLGINTPETVMLPSKDLPQGVTHESLGNLIYPLDWDSVFHYVGFPAVLKSCAGSNGYADFKIFNPSEFFSAYDMSGRKVMIYQKLIDYDNYYRCYVIGRKKAKLMNYDPTKPMHLRYSSQEPEIDSALEQKLIDISTKICNVLGFDFNAIEFAVKDGEPYVIEFLKTNPNADRVLVHDVNFEWLVKTTGDYLIELTKEKKSPNSDYNWSNYLSGNK